MKKVVFVTFSTEKKIAIIRTSSIGDVVLSTVVLSVLRDDYPNLQVIWIGKGPSLKLIEDCVPNLETISIENFNIKHLNDVDLLLDLQSNFRSLRICFLFSFFYHKTALRRPKNHLRRFCWLLKARLFGRWQTISDVKNYQLYTESVKILLVNGLKKIGLSANLKGSFTDFMPRLSPPLLDVFENENKSILCISTGAAFSTKRAPIEVFASIINKLDCSEFIICFVGDGNDFLETEKLTELLNTKTYYNFVGKFSLSQTAGILKLAKAFLGNDSSLVHISEAVGTPAVALFGPTYEGFGFIPSGPGSAAFSSNLGCRPCSKHGKKSCRYNDKKCFTTIDISKVVEHLSGLMAN